MDDMQKSIVTLLKSAITGEAYALPESFDLELIDPVVRKHHMIPLIYAGAVNCGVDRNNASMRRMFQAYCRAVQIGERQMRELERVFSSFETNEIDYLPLKGCVMKSLYPQPELRTMGDADVLIRMEQYERIREIIGELGFAEGEETEWHFVWKTDALCLELHRSLYKPDPVRETDYFKDAWRYASVREGRRHAMDAENTFAFLFAHFAEHFTLTGIGCRHVVDLWVYLRNHPEMDEARLREILGKLRLWRFYQNVRRLIAVWFEDGASDERTEFLSQVFFDSGSWGSSINAVLSEGLRDLKQTGSVSGSRLKYIRHRLFPDVRYFQNKYPVLRRHIWLLPAIWLLRLFQKLLSVSILRRRSEQFRMLNQTGIDKRKKMLEYVGLLEE